MIVGGGQAGLSLSAYLTSRDHAHVVLERGRVGERWRSERWDSLHMLTPNSLNRLDGAPGHADPEGFLARDAFVDYLEQYASSVGMPVREHVDVLSVERHRGRFRVHTDDGEWVAKHVVVATGDCGVPYRPPAASAAPPELAQLDAAQYRRPEQLAAGSVLVVGAGPSGLQIAAELRRSGREVVLAVGRHARGVRRYRGRDIFHWLQRLGDPEQSVDEVPAAARRTPGFGLSGQNGGEQLDLATVSELGVTLAGRLTGFDRLSASFDDNLRRDRRARRRSAVRAPRENRRPHRRVVGCRADPAGRAGRRACGLARGRASLDLRAVGVSTIVWATGYRREYPWLHIPVFDAQGEIVHRRGVTPVPGLFVLGLRFQSRRTSHTIGGVGRDAQAIADRIGPAPQAAPKPVWRGRPNLSSLGLRPDALVTPLRSLPQGSGAW